MKLINVKNTSKLSFLTILVYGSIFISTPTTGTLDV